MIDYYDIKSWKGKQTKYLQHMTDDGIDKSTTKRMVPLKVDIVKLFALLKAFISPIPNGIYTMMLNGLPLDNMIWWDFIMESEVGYIHIWRTKSILEVTYFVEGEIEFDINKFFHTNIKNYITDVQAMQLTFERHSVYINHYQSYKECVDYLWKEISKIDLTPPINNNNKTHLIDQKEFDVYSSKIGGFVENSVKFHTLGKSLVLNAAFTIESFLNLVIRVGATSQLRDYPDVLKKHLNTSFGDKLKNLKFYSIIFKQDIDPEHQAIKDSHELMTLRNKYVHFDESSDHNKLHDIFFDGDFPLHPTSKNTSVIDAIQQIYHKPDFNTVKKAYEASLAFASYLQSLFVDKYKQSVIVLMRQNPVGYNESRKMYSAIYNEDLMDFFLPIPAQPET